MKCPHCMVEFHVVYQEYNIGKDGANNDWGIKKTVCPACKMIIVYLFSGKWGVSTHQFVNIFFEYLVFPKTISRNPIPECVPKEYADDYKEACLVLSDSPKASAALSRRCLQNLLRDFFKVKKGDLYNEIQELINRNELPPYLASSIDYIRVIGNFAAHPLKSQSSGEIIEVEPGEAEWTLDVLEFLFEHCFVLPKVSEERRESINKKLQDAGKPPIK